MPAVNTVSENLWRCMNFIYKSYTTACGTSRPLHNNVLSYNGMQFALPYSCNSCGVRCHAVNMTINTGWFWLKVS